MANSSTSATAPPAAADQDIVGIFSTTDPAAVASVAARFSMTSAELHALHYTAIEARSGAYCPYSRFRVGCAVLTKAGITLYGANVENASYPVGICAERTALAKAVTDGHHRIGFKAVAVVTDVSPPCSPCGMCRQL